MLAGFLRTFVESGKSTFSNRIILIENLIDIDTVNSKLNDTDPKEFNDRINFYEKETQRLAQ